MRTRTRRPTTTPRHLAGGVAVTVAACVLALAPVTPAHAAPSDHAGIQGPPPHAASPHAASVDVGPDEITSPGVGASTRRGPSQRAGAPGQATSPGRSADAPGRQVPTIPSAAPTPDPAPAPTTEPAPAPRAAAPPAAPRPAPTTSTPAPSDSTRTAATGATTVATPVTASTSSSAIPASDAIPAGERTPPVGDAASPPSSSALLRSAIEAAADTAGAAGAGALASITDATAEAARRLAGGLQGGPGFASQTPLPARDLGIPMGVLALLGAYLALSRWLDRGGLPMTISDGREDDVQLVL